MTVHPTRTCDICGKMRGIGNHRACQKARQAKHKKQTPTRAKFVNTNDLGNYIAAVINKKEGDAYD